MASDTAAGRGAIASGTTSDETDVNDNCALLTNGSGGSVVTGDVLVQDTSTNDSFTTTTTAGDLRPVFVVPNKISGASRDGAADVSTKTILSTEAGWVQFVGECPKVTVNGAVAKGDYLKTHSSAKQAVSTGIAAGAGVTAPMGSFAVALESQAVTGTIRALLLGHTLSAPKHNFAATADPAVTDDAGDGYSVNSIWTNVTTDVSFICLDSTAGAAVWKHISPLPTAQYQYQTAAGVGAAGATGTAWTKYPLSDETYDTAGIGSLASSVITLAPGTYRVTGYAVFVNCGMIKTRLRDTTGAATLVVGVASRLGGANITTSSHLEGRFTITVSSALEVQYYVQTAGNLGENTNADGEANVWGFVKFEQE